MRTMSVEEAESRFGELLAEARKGPVTIERDGKPIAVVLSPEEHAAVERIKALTAEDIAAADEDDGREWTDEEYDAFLEEIGEAGRERIRALVAEGIAAADAGDVHIIETEEEHEAFYAEILAEATKDIDKE